MTTRLFQLRRVLVAFAVAALLLLTVSSTFAHNAGHIILPDGTCKNVGSQKDAPYVPAANPHQNSDGQLDLIPGAGDQYGARYAADQGNTPILPGGCP
jgi:hypothetical protein